MESPRMGPDLPISPLHKAVKRATSVYLRTGKRAIRVHLRAGKRAIRVYLRTGKRATRVQRARLSFPL